MSEIPLWVNLILILLILITALSALLAAELVSAVFLLSVMSFFVALLWSSINAVDVSFTEAMVGAGASTIFFLLALFRTDHRAKKPSFSYHPGPALFLTLALGILFLWGSLDLPLFGSHESPPNAYLSPQYLMNAVRDMHTPNVVSAVLADYRGLDTLIETAVVFTAGIACVLVIGGADD